MSTGVARPELLLFIEGGSNLTTFGLNEPSKLVPGKGFRMTASGSFKRKWFDDTVMENTCNAQLSTGLSVDFANVDLQHTTTIGSWKPNSTVNDVCITSASSASSSSSEVSKKYDTASNSRIQGTPDYLAPEVISRKGHGCEVDWWSLGVCFYEFLIGVRPFNDSTPDAIFNNIIARELEFPDEFDATSKDCIEAMLHLDPKERANLNVLKEERFRQIFINLDWDRLYDSPAPFVPTPSCPDDTQYYANRNIEMNIEVSEISTP